MTPFSLLISAAPGAHGDQHLTIFFVQLALLILVGRCLGEVLQRLGQPAVMGQLLAGILLGPSVFGAIWPDAQHLIFPAEASARPMLKGVSELGVLMLLLLTGMETDLALVKRVRRSAMFTSAAGVIVPFSAGYLLGELLPVSLLPDPNQRMVTSLFLATALSISSVKIVAVVMRETGFFRRDLGQLILASAILDDTIGWTLLALIAGLAAHGSVQVMPLVASVAGTILFLVFCFTIGRRIVALLIRWANDRLLIEMPVISLILVLMLGFGLVTNAIGVHTVLGAFMAGIMIGQSPILTKHIGEQLRGVIVALFMPVFFGVAGLSIDLKLLADPRLLGLTALLIAVATVGKLGGCYVGSRLAGLPHRESLAVGYGMNARGSTEVILATIGLGMGALNRELFTIIVLMAVLTTLAMPPMLRWALGRVPIEGEEKERLQAEAAEERNRMPKLERALVALDAGHGGLAGAHFAGALLGARRLSATIVDLDRRAGQSSDSHGAASGELLHAAEHAAELVKSRAGTAQPGTEVRSGDAVENAASTKLLSVLKRSSDDDDSPVDAAFLLNEAAKGYDLIFLGQTPNGGARELPPMLPSVLHDFPGSALVLLNAPKQTTDCPGQILVPSGGADFSRFAAEIAIGIARGCGATVVALHVTAPLPEFGWIAHQPPTRSERDVLGDLVMLGKREGVRVLPRPVTSRAREQAILREIERGGYDLVVLGIQPRPGEVSIFGPGAASILENARCPVLVVKS